MAHLAAGPGLGLAVEMQARAGLGEQRPASASTRRPIRFSITASRTRRGRASGSPQTARTSCSNWLAAQASIVQWPELCGRGASSLTSTAPSRVTNISTASSPDQVERVGDPPARSPARLATLAGDRRRGEGHVENMVAMAVLDRSKAATAPSWPRADDHRDSGRNRQALENAAAPADALPGGVELGPVARSRPGPCRHSRAGPSSARRAAELRDRARVRPASRPAPGGGGDASRVEEVLLAQPVLADARTAAPGRTGLRASKQLEPSAPARSRTRR